MARYRKKPVVVDAIQWTGDNTREIARFVGIPDDQPIGNAININTIEGTLRPSEGDYIIKGIKGEFYPCKPDIFKVTYEKVE